MQAGTAIIGIDIFHLKNGEPEHDSSGWSIRKSDYSLADYQRSSCLQAENYIRNFPDPDDGGILYSFVVSDDSTKDPDFKHFKNWFEEGSDYQRPDEPDE